MVLVEIEKEVKEDKIEDFKEYLKTLSLDELLEIHYKQACQINRIRDIILGVSEDK